MDYNGFFFQSLRALCQAPLIFTVYCINFYDQKYKTPSVTLQKQNKVNYHSILKKLFFFIYSSFHLSIFLHFDVVNKNYTYQMIRAKNYPCDPTLEKNVINDCLVTQ